MLARQLRLTLGLWLLLFGDAASPSVEVDETCSSEDETPANTPGRLMQVSSERRSTHPGTGQLLPLSPQDSSTTKHNKVPFGYFEYIFGLQSLGQLAFPPGISDLSPMGMADMSVPPQGVGGTIAFFGLFFLVLVCLLAVIACFGEEMDGEAQKAFEAKKIGQVPLEPQGSSALYSTTTAAVSQQASLTVTGSHPSSYQTIPSFQDSGASQPKAQGGLMRQAIPEEVQEAVPASQPLRVSPSHAEAASAQRPWESAYLPQVASAAAPNLQDGAEESAAHLPPMLTAFPPFWGGGPSPLADEAEEPEESCSDQPEPTNTLPYLPQTPAEAENSLPPFAFPDLGASEVPDRGPLQSLPADYMAFAPGFDPTVSGTLCHWMIVDPSSECAMAVPIADQDLPAVSMTILALDQRPVLKAEVYRGQECEAPPDFSPMIGDYWPPENVCLSNMERGAQRPSIVLTSLPVEIQRLDEDDKENVAADEYPEDNIQILSACYLVRADEQSLEFDIYNGNGEFFGRMGRDHTRSCRFMMRGGNFGEVRYFVDGVFEDYAVLFTDMCQDTVADGEPFETSDLPFPEAAGCMRLRVHGTQAVDAGLILTMLFCAYELRSLGA